MKNVFLALLCLIAINTYAQNAIDILSNSVGRISFFDKTNNGISSGTGTFICQPLPKNKYKVYLVTNKHVLPTIHQSDSIYFEIKDSRLSTENFFSISIPIFIGAQIDQAVKFDPDGNDLAVIDVTLIFIDYSNDLMHLTKYMLNVNELLPRDSIQRKRIGLGDEIFFMGYPNFIYDKRNVSPILRAGVIATSPDKDFYFNDVWQGYFRNANGVLPKLDGFLIDANAFPGSSGSLVITKPLKLRYGTQLYYSNEVSCLGILTYSFSDLSGSNQSQRVQLGGVISASQIIKTIKLFGY